MATVTIKFEFTNGSDSTDDFADFDAESGILGQIEEFADDSVSDLNSNDALCDEDDEEWELDDWSVDAFDTDYEDQLGPDAFNTLEDWAEYCEEADSADWAHRGVGGDAYVARHNDVGSVDMDEFCGSYSDFEEYAREYADDCLDLSGAAANYFDYASFANDLEMDYSVYDGGNGVLIFRDC